MEKKNLFNQLLLWLAAEPQGTMAPCVGDYQWSILLVLAILGRTTLAYYAILCILCNTMHTVHTMQYYTYYAIVYKLLCTIYEQTIKK